MGQKNDGLEIATSGLICMIADTARPSWKGELCICGQGFGKMSAELYLVSHIFINVIFQPHKFKILCLNLPFIIK